MLATSIGLQAQGTSWQTATLITSGSTKTGTLDDSTTEAWYKINVTQEGKIDMFATASGDLRFYPYKCALYGFKNNDTFWLGTDFTGNTGSIYTADTITYQATNVGKGTYYVRITRQSGSGTYKLNCTFTPCPLANDPEPNDDYEHSSLLQSGQTEQGHLGYRTSDDVTDNEDWYKFVVPEEGHIDIIVTGTETLTFSSSYVYGFWNNDTRRYGEFSGWYSDTITSSAINVGKGTYYIKVGRESGHGGYRIKYTFTPCPVPNDPEPNNDYEHSSLLQSGKTEQGRLGYRTSEDVTDTEDWYRFVVPEEGHIDIIITGTETLTFSNSYVYGYWNDDTRRYCEFSGWYNDTITSHATYVGKGTYYIKVGREIGSGGYRITYTFTPCPLANDAEPNEDYQHAAWLPSGKTEQGRLGYRTSEDVTDSEDWYRFRVNKEGVIEINVTGDEDLTFSFCYLYRLKANGDTERVGEFSDWFTNSLTSREFLVEGTYYAKISREKGSGGYWLTYNGTTLTGDVNGDNKVGITDVVRLSDHLLGVNSSSSFFAPDADVNGDGVINISDLAALVDILLASGH